MSKEKEPIKPKYTFAEVPDGTLIPIQPLKKTIAKTMEVTENFNMFDVMTYIAKMKKAIEDKKAEVEGLEIMLKAYEDELKVIEAQLGIQKLEDEYQKSIAEQTSQEPVLSPIQVEDLNDDEEDKED